MDYSWITRFTLFSPERNNRSESGIIGTSLDNRSDYSPFEKKKSKKEPRRSEEKRRRNVRNVIS